MSEVTFPIKIRQLLVFFLLSTGCVFAGNKDSLLNIIQTSTDDSVTILTFRELTYFHLFEEYDLEQAIKYLDEGIEYSKKKESHYLSGKMMALKGYVEQFYINDFASSISYYFAALDEYEKVSAVDDRFAIYLNLGNLYYNYKQYKDAIKFLSKAVENAELTGSKDLRAEAFLNLGVVYYMGEIDNGEALSCLNQARDYYFSEQDSLNLAMIDFNLTNLMFKTEDISLKKRVAAIETYDRVRKIFKTYGIDDFYFVATTNLATQLSHIGSYSDAKMYLLECKELAMEQHNYSFLIEIFKSLAENAEAQQNYQEQVVFLKKAAEYNDSLFNENKAKAISETEIKYETEKINAQNELLQKEGEIKDLELTASKAEASAQQQQKLYLFGGLGLVALFGIFMFNRFRVTNKQKNIIDAQKTLVEEQKAEVESQKVELESTHQQLAEHHKEISDSINYAKRIQEAIMPSMESMNEALKNGFVLYLPKDVVAGDFFWMESIEDTVFYAAADCTGHGVPGAMVSVVCSNALNKALLEEGIRDTGKLLDRTRELVIQRLAKSGEDVKDGMDISLCALNMNTRSLRWSGANNPLWILRKGGEEIEETKANKQPIGVYHQPTPFTSHEIVLNEGDAIYVFTDGYQDQFGGPKGKKFKAKQLKDLIIANQHKLMDEQLVILEQEFMNWKGEVEQIDDVCVIGVKV